MRRTVVATLALVLVLGACGEAPESGRSTTMFAPTPSTTEVSDPPSVTSTFAPPVIPTLAPPPPAPVDVPDGLVDDNTALALELFTDIARREEGNVFLGPASISEGLALVYLGARGETAQEMADVLHFGLESDALHEGFGALRRALSSRNRDALELAVANRAFGQDGVEFLDAYLADLSRYHEAPLGRVDFAGDSEGARRVINEWTADQTAGRIDELFPEGTIKSNTVLALVSATYLNAAWFFPFNPDNTEQASFSRDDGSVVTVEMMNFNEYLPTVTTPDYDAARIPYTGGELSMIVIVPRSMSPFVTEFDADELDDIRENLSDGGIHLYLPKFELSYHTSLIPSLNRLGLELPFSPAADFSGMTGTSGLFIDTIEHETFVSIDEAGTEAAAATGTNIALSHGPTVRADRPFVFVIQDDATGAVLFVGKVADPTG